MKKGVIVVLVVGIAAALGFLAQRLLPGDPAAPAAQQTATPDTAPAESASVAQSLADKSVIPETLPQFELADRDGKLRRLGEWKGQPLLVNYWATWCAPCRREIPLLNELRTEHKAMKLEVIGIAVDFRDDVLKYATENPIHYPLLIGEEDGLAAVKAMGVEAAAFPFTVFADSQQRILAVKFGELHRDDAELILGRLAGVEAGTLLLPEARAQITAGLKELATRRALTEAKGKG